MLLPINRNAVIITPLQPFFDLLTEISGEEYDHARPLMTDDASTVYLIEPDDFGKLDLEKLLKPCFEEIFFEQIEGWYTDTENWPDQVSWEEFTKFFHISYQSMVFDTQEGDIEKDYF